VTVIEVIRTSVLDAVVVVAVAVADVLVTFTTCVWSERANEAAVPCVFVVLVVIVVAAAVAIL